MERMAVKKNVYTIGGGLMTPAQRAAILRRTRGSWKTPLKESLRTLSVIRRGWNRKII